MKDRITDSFAEVQALDVALERCPALREALQFSHDAYFRPNVPYEMLGGLIFPTAQLPGLFPPEVGEYGVLLKLPVALQGQLQDLSTRTPCPAASSAPELTDDLPHACWETPDTRLCVPLQALADLVDLCAPYCMMRRRRPAVQIPVVMVAGERIALSTFTPPSGWDDHLQALSVHDWDPDNPCGNTQDRLNRLLKHGKRYSFMPSCVPAACYAKTSMADWPAPLLWLPMMIWFAADRRGRPGA